MISNDFKTEDLIKLRQLETFAPLFLKVRDKSGAIVPLVFNKAQKHVNNLLNEQLKKKKKVR